MLRALFTEGIIDCYFELLVTWKIATFQTRYFSLLDKACPAETRLTTFVYKVVV